MKHRQIYLPLFFCLFLSSLLSSKDLTTCYGVIDVEEAVLWDLIESPAMQRLKGVRQYGACYYSKNRELYDRFQHSIGVFTLLRLNGASLEEQIAGLLHDASHTAFSHFADYYFDHGVLGDSYQDSIHFWYLEKVGLGEVLEQHGFTAEQVCPKTGQYALLEQSLPDICADRLDYNLQGAYRRGWLTQEQVQADLDTWSVEGHSWFCTDIEAAKRIGYFSLFMTENCWGAAEDAYCNMWLGEAVNRASELGILDLNDLFFGTDDAIWTALSEQDDALIQDRLEKIRHPQDYVYAIPFNGEGAHSRTKFRGINPWILVDGEMKRLSDLDADYCKEFERVKDRVSKGWSVILL